MLDLSNHNGAVDFGKVKTAAHQLRVYLKLSEGVSFLDADHAAYRKQALAAGLKVGEYHYARPSKNTPREEADAFLRLLPAPIRGKTLVPALDFEDPAASGRSGHWLGDWASAWLTFVKAHLGYSPVIYGSPSYLAACNFARPPAPLWLASYGRNDGLEHPFTIPKPWSAKNLAAHQYSSQARVAGVAGTADLSHVFRPRYLDVPVPLWARPYYAVRVIAGKLVRVPG